MTSVHFTITSNLGLTLPPSHWTRARSLVGAKWQAIRIQFLQRTYICTAFYILIAWWSVQEAVLFADGIIKYSNISCWWLIGTHNTVTIIRIHCQCKTAVWPQEVTEYQWLICIITWRRINCLKVCFYQNTNTFSNHNSKQPLLM